MIKILHTSDWHLGKRFFQLDRHLDHQYFINWFLDLIKTESPDIVIIAGDIFDTHQPPHQAQNLFFKFLKSASDLKTKIVFIAGNHDSRNFLNAPGPLYNDLNIYFKTNILDNKNPFIELSTPSGNLNIFLLPYFKWSELNEWINLQEQTKHKEINDDGSKVNEYILKYISKYQINNGNPNILVSHHSYGQYYAEGTELSINIAGIESIQTDIFKENFDLVCLGHIHKHNQLESSPLTMYSGAPLVFRNGENCQKFINRIEIDSSKTESHKIVIPNIREIRSINLSESNWRQELENISQSKGILPTFITIYIKMEYGDYTVIDNIKSFLKESDLIIVNIIPQNNQTAQETSVNVEQIYNIESVFDLFYQSNFSHGIKNSQSDAGNKTKAEIKRKFLNVLDQIKSSQHKDREYKSGL